MSQHRAVAREAVVAPAPETAQFVSVFVGGKAVKRRVADAPADPAVTKAVSGADMLQITPLGAGQEVGRSCIILKYKQRTIMLDCGVHPAFTGMAQLPYLDAIDPSKVDMLLLSHFHLDHSAAVPWLCGKTGFKGKVFMTHATTAIYKLMLSDYLRVSKNATEEGGGLFSFEDVQASLDRITSIDYEQEESYLGVKFWAINAGHVLGAAQFVIELAGVRIVYTGDFSCEEDRHLPAAAIPSLSPDVLICESTYGVQIHEPQKDREARLTGTVQRILKRGGRCLIPVFALGRTQELLLILNEFWEKHPEMQRFPIYFASSLANKALKVYQTYLNMMNAKIRAQMTTRNPFELPWITSIGTKVSEFTDTGPCVVMASPGMLQSGLSRELFERWCTDSRNGCIVPGYCVEGTLAKHILTSPDEISTQTGISIPLRCSVDYISFSAHTDFRGTSDYVDRTQPPNIVLVHGDKNEMMRLKTALLQRFSERELQIVTPTNTQTVSFSFRGEKVARAVGDLAAEPPKDGQAVRGVLVRKDFAHRLLLPHELTQFTQLKTSQVSLRQVLPFHPPWSSLVDLLRRIYDDVDVSSDTTDSAVITLASGGVALKQDPPTSLVLEMTSSRVNEIVCDAVLVLVLELERRWITQVGEDVAAAAIGQRSRQLLDSMLPQPGADHQHDGAEDKQAHVPVYTRVFAKHFGAQAVVYDAAEDAFVVSMPELGVDVRVILADMSVATSPCSPDAVVAHKSELDAARLRVSGVARRVQAALSKVRCCAC